MSEKKTRCVLNVKDKMKEYAYRKDGHKRQVFKLNVSADSIQEMISMLDAQMDVRMNLAVQHALKAGRKTVMAEDVVKSFGIVDPGGRDEE